MGPHTRDTHHLPRAQGFSIDPSFMDYDIGDVFGRDVTARRSHNTVH